MRKIFIISLAFIVSCNVLGNKNNETEIRYVVKDFSDDPVEKEISYIHGNSGELLVVMDNNSHWERTVIFGPNLDASISAKVVTSDLIYMGVYIYKNDELVESKEYHQAHELTITHLN